MLMVFCGFWRDRDLEARREEGEERRGGENWRTNERKRRRRN
jgi:hypothetical protein